MKKQLQSLAVIAWLALTKAIAQNADPAVTSAAFAPTSTAIGQTSVLTVNFSNAGTTAIPAGSIEVTISAPYSYYANGGTPFPTGSGATLFTWTYLGSDTWRGVNINSIAAAAGGAITITVKGLSITSAAELTNVNVQPVNSFAAFSDSPNNNNLQPGLVVLADTDGDGTPDDTDTDDDNDGILDTQDKLPLDTDNDGTPNVTDIDDDGDGILDTAEAAGKALDTDNDGTPNSTDTDDDNDGILDTAEMGTLDGSGKYTLPDSDGDGVPDLIDAVDTDGDGIPDSTDTDDDNDGLPDVVDKLPLDTDNDGTPNVTDTDDDGDGILDTAEAAGKALDTDNDGTPNATDTDDDNDGILDTAEIGTFAPDGKFTLPDSDNDGLPDLADPNLTDTDGDGTPDNTDTDDDNDGILDTQDKLPLDTDNDGTPNATDTDDDGDGILDTAEAAGKALDTDNDGTPNATDTDDDNDGILDTAEMGTLDGSGKYTLPDSDGDGVPDLIDAAAKADLFGNYTFGNITFAAADTKTVIININEINGGATNGTVEFFVPSMAGFTVTFNSTQTSATVTANETVNNSDWVMVDTGTGMKFSSKAGVVIAANGRSRIALTIKADTAGTTANLTTNITPGSGGDGVTTNNVAVLAMSIQN